jgi:hypothetical protein
MSQNQRKSGWILKTGMLVCGILAVVCLVFGVVEWAAGTHALDNSDDLGDLGNFGSFLQGTVASLWALAGVFLIVLAFLGQQQQLTLQRMQLAGQEQQFNTQLESIKLQSFESSFFQLLNLQREVTAELHIVGHKINHSGAKSYDPMDGRECFEGFYLEFQRRYHTPTHELKAAISGQLTAQEKAKVERIDVATLYIDCYAKHQQQLGHYFRNLYHTVKFVKLSDAIPKYENKRRYTSLARAQLSAYEVVMLFYNCLSPHGAGFKPLVEEFGLLEHLDHNLLLDESHKDFYA